MRALTKRWERGAMVFVGAVLIGWLATPVSAQSMPCVGDCDGNGEVFLSELVVGLGNALLRPEIDFPDIGLVFVPSPGPGPNLGTVRRIRFEDGRPLLPEIMDDGLNFPDGIGILE